MKLEDRIAYLEEQAQYYWAHLTARSQDEDTQALYMGLWESCMEELADAERELAWEEAWEEAWAYEN